MSDLRFNTIAGVTLASLLVVMGLGTVSETAFHPHFPEKPGYSIDISSQLTPIGGGGGPAEEAPMDWGVLLASADAAALGEKVAAAKCASCHTFVSGGPNQTGPNLYNVVNRTSAAHAGFAYSSAMKAHSKDWTYEELNAFLTAPNRHIKGTIMAFVGLKRPEERGQVIAYLRSLSPSPASIPAPLPPQAPAPEGNAPADAPPEAPAATEQTPPAPAEPAEGANVPG